MLNLDYIFLLYYKTMVQKNCNRYNQTFQCHVYKYYFKFVIHVSSI